jgi:CDP-glucose 4,6-dehydratase
MAAGMEVISLVNNKFRLNKLMKIKIFTSFKPEIVFHLAAQPLVRLSYLKPVETFSTNLMGTINILEACRNCSTVKAIVAISSDKCYENIEQLKGYTEEDPMGGSDPYSASKGAMEIILQSYRRSFFNPALSIVTFGYTSV